MSGDPYPKSQQLRGSKERKYKRKVASPRRWQQIADAKQGPCRCCQAPAPNQLHHILSRAQGGADTEANIAPLCDVCHGLVTRRDAKACWVFVDSLDDREYAYALQHGGDDFFERAYGLTYERAA